MTKLTDATVKNRLSIPAAGNAITYDDNVAGFGCRVTATGAKSFVLNYRTKAGRERRITIGRFPNWTTVAARAKAKELRRLIDDGGDPLADIEELRAAPTVSNLCDRFEEEHLPRKRPATIEAYRRILVSHIRPHFGAHFKVADVAFTDVDALHRAVTKHAGPYIANRVVAVLSKMFSLAIRWGWRDANPCLGIERNYEQKRKRYLSGDELARLTQALAAHSNRSVANAIRLLLLTGARRGEILSMRWADIDLGAGIWTKLGSTTKQKTDHVVPLSGPVRLLLTEIRSAQPLGEYVFAGAGKGHHLTQVKRDWVIICKAAKITGLRIHDLRHSFASQLAGGGASLPLIGALLGHSNPTTTARYAHLFSDPQRAAMEKVGAIIDAAGNGNGADTVKPFSPKGRHAGRPAAK
jgi:integrase